MAVARRVAAAASRSPMGTLMAMRILGIDPGLNVTGYGCVEVVGEQPSAFSRQPSARQELTQDDTPDLRNEGPDPATPRARSGPSRTQVRLATTRTQVQRGTKRLQYSDSASRLVEAGVIRLRRDEPMSARLVQLHDDLAEVLADLSPDLVVVEKLFSHYKHVRTSILMGHARGVVLLAARQHGAAVDELAATEVKKAVCGNGHASKMQIQLAVMSQCGLAAPPEPHDVADAIAIALCATRRRMLEQAV